MEVAFMNSFLVRTCFKGKMAAVGVILMLAGCADINTSEKYSRDTGLKLYRQGNYAEAAGAFRNAARQEPRDYKSHYYLGQSYEAMQQYQQAIQAYKSSLDTMQVTLTGRADDAFRLQVLDGLASAIGKSSDRNIEIDLLEKQAAGKPTAQDHFLLAKIYRYGGDPDLAIQHYRTAARLRRDDFYIQKEFGLYLEQLGQSQEAADPLSRAYALDTKDEQVVAALRRIGIEPGLSLKDEGELSRPVIPKGPIPRLKLGKDKPRITETNEPSPKD